MKYGVITQAQDWPQKDARYLHGAHGQWVEVAGGVPGYYPILHRLGESDPDVTARMLMVIPNAILYLTSTMDPASIENGCHDEELSKINASVTPDMLVRFNHEPNARNWIEATWTSWTPDSWAKAFRHVTLKVGGAPFVCLIHTKRSPGDWEPYLDRLIALGSAPDVLGFDAYVENAALDIDLEARYQPKVDYLIDSFGGPIVIGEMGIAPGPGRRNLMRQVRGLEGVEGVVWMDWAQWKLGARARQMLGRWMR